MKRSTWDGQTVVYRYGCPSWAQLPDSAMEQLRLAHWLRNELVAVEYHYREIVAGIWGLHPQVAEAQVAVEAATTQIERIKGEMKRHRVEDQSTRPRRTANSEFVAARKTYREAKAKLKAVKDLAKTEQGPLLKEAAACRYAALTAVRAEAVKRGLFWATANDVKDKHDSAAKRIAEAWKSGRPANRRSKHWKGTGTLCVQLQREQHKKHCDHKRDGLCPGCSTKPLRTPDVLASSLSPWRNVFRLESSREHPRWGTAWVRFVNADVGPLTPIPVVLHRPLPADGEVTDVRVTRFRVGSSYRLSVAVTVRLPHPAPPAGGVPMVVKLGWGSEGDGRWLDRPNGHRRFVPGSVLVARVYSPLGAPPREEPADLLDVLAPAEQWTDVVAPSMWRTLLARDESIRSYRDELLDELRPLVVDALSDPVLASMLEVRAADVARWRAPRKFARLARVWPADHPLAGKLEAWRKRDRHLWDYESHERRQVIDRRRDAWRKVAAWICSQASEVLLDTPPVAVVREKPGVDAEDTMQARAGRALVQFAAPGELAMLIRHAAMRRGVKVVDVRNGGGDG